MLKRIISKVKNKKGMTLIEVLVASTISFIVLVGVVSLVVPTTKAIQKNQQLSDAQHMSELVINKLTKELKYTKGITVDSLTVDVTNPNPLPSVSSSQACLYTETVSDVGQIKFKSKTDADLTTAKDVVGTHNYNKMLDYKLYFKRAEISDKPELRGATALEVYIQACKKNTNVVVYQTRATIPLLNNPTVFHQDSALDTVTDITGFDTAKRYYIYY